MNSTRSIYLFACALSVLALFITASTTVAQPLKHLDSQRFGGASDDQGNSVATDASGNVFMTGKFQGTVDFGGGALVSAGITDIVLVKYGAAASGVGDTPQSYVLSVSNFPNPFNPITNIRFDLARTERVSLRVYDLEGRLVRTLVNEDLSQANHTYQWDGTDAGGRPVASGVYYYRVQTSRSAVTGAMSLVK